MRGLTFVAINDCILDNHTSSVHSRDLLRFASHLTEVLWSLLAGDTGAAGRDSQDMTREELLRREELLHGRAALGLPEGEQNIRERDKEDVMMDGTALGGDRAFEEGGKEGIEWVHSLDLTASR